jgi:hypothetical protein
MMSQKSFYSVRNGLNKNLIGVTLEKIKEMFVKIYGELSNNGYFSEAFGYECVDLGDVCGTIIDPELDIMLKTRKDNLWPIYVNIPKYSEDDLFDVIEYLFTIVSKPLEGYRHDYAGCGMHWSVFSKEEGQQLFHQKVSHLLSIYSNPYEFSLSGDVLRKADKGFSTILEADIRTDDEKVRERVDLAISKYRLHGSTPDDRRQAVRELSDVLEYLRPSMKIHLNKKDESDLFNIINNFGVRHYNSLQQNDYDSLWLNWMFYVFLATIHVILRKSHKI